MATGSPPASLCCRPYSSWLPPRPRYAAAMFPARVLAALCCVLPLLHAEWNMKCFEHMIGRPTAANESQLEMIPILYDTVDVVLRPPQTEGPSVVGVHVNACGEDVRLRVSALGGGLEAFERGTVLHVSRVRERVAPRDPAVRTVIMNIHKYLRVPIPNMQ